MGIRSEIKIGGNCEDVMILNISDHALGRAFNRNIIKMEQRSTDFVSTLTSIFSDERMSEIMFSVKVNSKATIYIPEHGLTIFTYVGLEEISIITVIDSMRVYVTPQEALFVLPTDKTQELRQEYLGESKIFFRSQERLYKQKIS